MKITEEKLANSISKLSEAITPSGTFPGTDACGGTVASLTEAIMGITAGLNEIAKSIYTLGEVIDNKTEK
jgi:hypothetical protein